MTKANATTSRVPVTWHARFWNGGGAGDRSTDRNRQKSEINKTLNQTPISRQKAGCIHSGSEGKATRSGYDKWAPSRARVREATARDDGKGERSRLASADGSTAAH